MEGSQLRILLGSRDRDWPFRKQVFPVPTTSELLLTDASAEILVVDEAASVLMTFLHCGEAEALALLRAQSHSAHVDLVDVAAAMVEAGSPR